MTIHCFTFQTILDNDMDPSEMVMAEMNCPGTQQPSPVSTPVPQQHMASSSDHKNPLLNTYGFEWVRI